MDAALQQPSEFGLDGQIGPERGHWIGESGTPTSRGSLGKNTGVCRTRDWERAGQSACLSVTTFGRGGLQTIVPRCAAQALHTLLSQIHLLFHHYAYIYRRVHMTNLCCSSRSAPQLVEMVSCSRSRLSLFCPGQSLTQFPNSHETPDTR